MESKELETVEVHFMDNSTTYWYGKCTSVKFIHVFVCLFVCCVLVRVGTELDRLKWPTEMLFSSAFSVLAVFVYSTAVISVTVSLLHNNIQQCLHSSYYSSADKPASYCCLWRWWTILGQTESNIYPGYHIWSVPAIPSLFQSSVWSKPSSCLLAISKPETVHVSLWDSPGYHDYSLRLSQCLTPTICKIKLDHCVYIQIKIDHTILNNKDLNHALRSK